MAAARAVSKGTIPEGPIFGVATGTLPAMLWRFASAILATLSCSLSRAFAMGGGSIVHLKDLKGCDRRSLKSV